MNVKDQQPETPFTEREITHAEEKRQIAQEAIRLIKPKDRIVLGCQYDGLVYGFEFPDIPLTVLTNSIKVALELSGKEKIEVISTGGLLRFAFAVLRWAASGKLARCVLRQ